MILSGGQTTAAPTLSTLGDSTPLVGSTAAYYAPSSSVALAGQWLTYAQIYRRQPWVKTVVGKLARGLARLPISIEENAKPVLPDWTTAPSDLTPGQSLANLFDRPNPTMDRYRLFEWVSSIFDIYGEAFLLKLRIPSGPLKGRVVALMPVHPTLLQLRTVAGGELRWIFSAPGLSASTLEGFPSFAYNDVIPFVSFDPDQTHRGMSNLEPLNQTLFSEDAARRATSALWTNGVRPSVILASDKKLNDAGKDRLRSAILNAHAGPDNRAGVLVLEDGVTPTIVQLDMEEMAYIDSRKLNREEVCGVYDVPPAAVQIMDKATFSNITENLRSVYRDTQGNRLPAFESAIYHHLVQDFASDGSLAFEFDLDDVLRGDFEARAAATVPLVSTAIATPNEARKIMGLPRSTEPLADKLFGNAALEQLGAVQAQAELAAGNPAPAKVDTNGNLLPKPLGPRPAQPATIPALPAGPTKTLITGQKRVDPSFYGRLARKADPRADLVAAHRTAVAGQLSNQAQAVKNALIALDPTIDDKPTAGDIYDPSEHDQDMVDALDPLSSATARLYGNSTAKALGGAFVLAKMAERLAGNVTDAAQKINVVTSTRIQSALDGMADGDDDYAAAIDGVFDDDGRVDQIAQTRVTDVAGAAADEAAQQNDAEEKTWHTHSANPRPGHDIDGETVVVGDTFSNGLSRPGDPDASVDDVAGCSCTITYSRTDSADDE